MRTPLLRRWVPRFEELSRALGRPQSPRGRQQLRLEALEGRWLPSGGTYYVTNDDDAGDGSFRQAIEDANSNPGSVIVVEQSLTITPQSPLPAIRALRRRPAPPRRYPA